MRFYEKNQVLSCVYTDLLQLLLQPIRRHFEIRKGPDSRLAEKRSFADFRNIANAIKGKRFHENEKYWLQVDSFDKKLCLSFIFGQCFHVTHKPMHLPTC